MVDVTTQDLARRAVSCEGWKWLPGMLGADTGLRLDELSDDWEAQLPDLTDPATIGALLSLVRETWEDQTIAARFSDEHGHWIVDGNRYSDCALYCDTEAAALVAALEDANA